MIEIAQMLEEPLLRQGLALVLAVMLILFHRITRARVKASWLPMVASTNMLWNPM